MPSLIYNDIAFIHVPKTGGSSISTLIPKAQYFIDKYKNIIDNNNNHFQLLHASAYLIKNTSTDIKLMIGFVRNPYTRFISLFCMSKNIQVHDYPISIDGILNFCNNFKKSNLINEYIFKPMKFFLYEDSKCIVDYIFYYENYDNEVKKFLEILNIDYPVIIPKINYNLFIDNSEYNNWYQMAPKLYDFVNEIYDEDFKTFNYEKILN